MSLSDSFRLVGFVVVENLFSQARCDEITGHIKTNFRRNGRAGIRNLMSDSAIQKIAQSKEAIDLLTKLCGNDMIPYKATLFEKTGKASWLVAFHQDTALPVETVAESEGWGPSSVKDGVTFSHAPSSVLQKIVALRIHLDASTTENGPLRVIPRSHEKRVQDDDEFEQIVSRGPILECPVGQGGVIAMSPLIFHASSKIKNDMPRRVLHIEYARSLDLEEGVRLACA